jgi:hypothetical protein
MPEVRYRHAILTGSARFAFASKYEEPLPTDHTQFRFRAGDLSFKSTDQSG